jgi:hypothetical protein
MPIGITDPPAEVVEKQGRLVLLCYMCSEQVASMRTHEDLSRLEAFEEKLDHVIASTGDIRREYEILEIIHVYVEPFDVSRAVLSLKDKAFRLGADGVIFIEFDTVVYKTGPAYVRPSAIQTHHHTRDRIGLSAYGTAVRFI